MKVWHSTSLSFKLCTVSIFHLCNWITSQETCQKKWGTAKSRENVRDGYLHQRIHTLPASLNPSHSTWEIKPCPVQQFLLNTNRSLLKGCSLCFFMTGQAGRMQDLHYRSMLLVVQQYKLLVEHTHGELRYLREREWGGEQWLTGTNAKGLGFKTSGIFVYGEKHP